MAEYEVVIGLETHIQLNTTTKIFCACKADSWFDPPNTNICPVCTGLPGVLPVLNQAVVEKGVLLAAAMHAEPQPVSYFDRKNYFYPDLPKGYQISQYDMPLARGGYLDVPMPEGYVRRVTITKLHIEEDAGKTKNELGQRLIDFNRCGVPLLEIVSEPDIRTPAEAGAYLRKLRQILQYLEVCDGNMEEGSFRCDANVSVRPRGSDQLGTLGSGNHFLEVQVVDHVFDEAIAPSSVDPTSFAVADEQIHALARTDPRVVHQQIDGPKGFQRFVNQPGAIRRLRNIRLDDDAPCACVFNTLKGFLRCLPVLHVIDDYGPAASRQSKSYATPDPARRAGDESDSSHS